MAEEGAMSVLPVVLAAAAEAVGEATEGTWEHKAYTEHQALDFQSMACCVSLKFPEATAKTQ
jgi:hypothetical protein